MTPKYRTGDKVTIKTGTHAGKIGTVQRADDVKPIGVAFVSVGTGSPLSYGFDELEPSPSTDGVDRAYRDSRQP